MSDCWAGRWNYVYSVYNSVNECIYVGCTIYPRKHGVRWKNHRSTNPLMVAEAARARMMGPFTYKVAARIEIEQQLILRPKYNRIRVTRPVLAVAKRLSIELPILANDTG